MGDGREKSDGYEKSLTEREVEAQISEEPGTTF